MKELARSGAHVSRKAAEEKRPEAKIATANLIFSTGASSQKSSEAGLIVSSLYRCRQFGSRGIDKALKDELS
jgi:hypothetical protein